MVLTECVLMSNTFVSAIAFSVTAYGILWNHHCWRQVFVSFMGNPCNFVFIFIKIVTNSLITKFRPHEAGHFWLPSGTNIDPYEKIDSTVPQTHIQILQIDFAKSFQFYCALILLLFKYFLFFL